MSSKSAFKLAVVGGAGRLGLPLALAFADRGVATLICDANEAALETIGRGRMPFREKGGARILASAIRAGNIGFTSDAAKLRGIKTVVLAVPTSPESALEKCLDQITPHLLPGSLLVVCSTLPMGAAQSIATRFKSSVKKALFAYCPQRAVEGKILAELSHFPQIIGADTRHEQKAATAVFARLGVETIPTTLREAEFGKLLCNAYRYIDFAIANAFYMALESAGVASIPLIAKLKKNYPRLAGMAQPGFVGGYCLAKDMRLFLKAADLSFGREALVMNNRMPAFIVDELRRRYPISKMTIGILGMSYKRGSDDVRNAAGYELKRLLEKEAHSVIATDPYLPDDLNLLPLEATIDQSDLLLIAVPHPAYEQIDFRGKPLFKIGGPVKSRS